MVITPLSFLRSAPELFLQRSLFLFFVLYFRRVDVDIHDRLHDAVIITCSVGIIISLFESFFCFLPELVTLRDKRLQLIFVLDLVLVGVLLAPRKKVRV